MIKPAYSVSFLLSINIFVWQNVLYFLDAPRTFYSDVWIHLNVYICLCVCIRFFQECLVHTQTLLRYIVHFTAIRTVDSSRALDVRAVVMALV